MDTSYFYVLQVESMETGRESIAKGGGYNG